jgi:proteasome lid subunit RPN8/RPN11
MRIEIGNEDLNQIKQHGESDYPYECCGFLFGKTDKDTKTVILSKPVVNARDTGDRHNRYLISPGEYLKAERMAKSKGLDVIGFYHSHPDADARPSQYDLDYSWPFYSYIIISIKNNKAEKATSWQLMDDRSKFLNEELVVNGEK